MLKPKGKINKNNKGDNRKGQKKGRKKKDQKKGRMGALSMEEPGSTTIP